jgi:hypothetical protein
MNVGDLRKLLADHPDDTLVVLSKDAEGNNFSPLRRLDDPDEHRYFPSTKYSGDIMRTDMAERRGDPGEMVVVLWPTN